MIDRRGFLAATGASSLLSACASVPGVSALGGKTGERFPDGFMWGVSTAGHQIEGHNVSSDLWYLEQLPDTVFKERSGDATNSFNMWETDLDITKAMGVNTFRFSLEWARIEPVEGHFSYAMIDHYRRILEGCKARGLRAFVTFNHFTSPFWFAADGGWTNSKAPERFARFCKFAAEELGHLMDSALTLNEPQIVPLMRRLGLPQFVVDKTERTLDLAEKELGVEKFGTMNVARYSDIDRMQEVLVEGHMAGVAAIKSVHPNLPVGVSIAIFDDQEGEEGSIRDEVREELYGIWIRACKGDDFLGIQNYERMIWGKTGKMKPPEGGPRNHMNHEVYAPSLVGAVKYGHEASGIPIIVTEHGVGTEDDSVRAQFIQDSLVLLQKEIAAGLPVLGYCHWSLLDNFEWVFGYGPKLGLVSVDHSTFERTPKPSSKVYGRIARANAL